MPSPAVTLFKAYKAGEHYRQNSLLIILLYKLAGLFCGTSFAYMGYRLFIAGVFEKAGNFEQTYGKEHLLLKEAAPGTFFVLFGCVIVAITLWRRLEVNLHFSGGGPKGDQLFAVAAAAAAASGVTAPTPVAPAASIAVPPK